MSYTPPAGNAAHFTFAGTYTPKLGGRADLTWEVLAAGFTRAQGAYSTAFGGPLAPVAHTGWSSTRFGIAAVPFVTTGELITVFGSPRWGVIEDHTSSVPSTTFGTAAIEPRVAPIYGTVFGLPNSPYLQTGVPDGFSETAFGSPRLVAYYRAFGAAPSTRVSTAYYAINQTAESTGITATGFGTPIGTRRTSSGGVLCRAESTATTALGTPTAMRLQTAVAAGSVATAFGTPGSTGGYGRVTGISRTRFGKARAQSRLNVRYAGGTTSTALGAPTGAIRNRAASFDIVSRFGTPLLTRSTTC